MDHIHAFPRHFIWGTSTAAYQIEGAVTADGRGTSIWDTFCHTPGTIKNSENADIACDHYNRLEEDLDLIATTGPHYRCSISWPRVLPHGTGQVNEKGIDFYNRLINGLLERGVTPWVTMYHWDLPQALQDKGGWTHRDISNWFQDYAHILLDRFGDRVNNWMIVNEPSAISLFGHGYGFHAPGLTGLENLMPATHHLNLTIGQVYRMAKSLCPTLNIGSTYTRMDQRPETPDTPLTAVESFDCLWNRNFYDPLLLGRYPAQTLPYIKRYIQNDDMDIVKTDLDFIGIQHYAAIYVREDSAKIYGAFFGDNPTQFEKTGLGWPIDPDGFYDCLMHLKKTYPHLPPIIITENGAVFDDTLDKNGTCHDPKRIAFLKDYIAALSRAIADGVDVRGYFAWTLMDNFEWAEGYTPRFGLVHVDRATLKRTPKSSWQWYRQLIQNNGLLPEG